VIQGTGADITDLPPREARFGCSDEYAQRHRTSRVHFSPASVSAAEGKHPTSLGDSAPQSVCVIGLGRVGLPIACVLAEAGFVVHGVDINEKIVADIVSECTPPEPGLKQLLEASRRRGTLTAGTEVQCADVFLVAVPTPRHRDGGADLSAVNSAVDSLMKVIRPCDLLVLESTCPIGTTEAIASRVRRVVPGVSVAYGSERVLPGNVIHEVLNNDRVVGGVDRLSTERAMHFYGRSARGAIIGTDSRTAEGVKLAENAYRDVTIAFANELSMLFDRAGIDAVEAIRLANQHPRVNIPNPGPGVGGHCIPIDPWFLVDAAPDLAALLRTAREVNLSKTQWVVERIRESLAGLRDPVVTCLGLTYKPDVDDLRESPSASIVGALRQDAKILVVDPFIPTAPPLNDALDQADVVVGLVAHKEFRAIPPERLRGKKILDFGGVFQ
jgi:UDP-N-acetyl-D-mannosaminuronic acid dehydrogenase